MTAKVLLFTLSLHMSVVTGEKVYYSNLVSYGEEVQVMDIFELKAQILRKGLTQKEVANTLGIAPKTFSNRLKNNTLTLAEANKLIKLLQIDNPEAFFFGTKVN